jgi:hypothetical protein
MVKVLQLGQFVRPGGCSGREGVLGAGFAATRYLCRRRVTAARALVLHGRRPAAQRGDWSPGEPENSGSSGTEGFKRGTEGFKHNRSGGPEESNDSGSGGPDELDHNQAFRP